MDAAGYLSLDPTARSATFPVFTTSGESELDFKVMPDASTKVLVDRCAARVMPKNVSAQVLRPPRDIGAQSN
jgi:hypothetical protein